MVMAPAGGTFSTEGIAEGTHVRAGSKLGTVRTRKEDLQVSASYAGVLVEWLLQDGDLVDQGEPLARLVPGTAEEAR
jgi:[acyl-carrier-protein] S-malonyltransferase